jgi:hypothetical protein
LRDRASVATVAAMFEDDYLKRMVKQIAALAARLLGVQRRDDEEVESEAGGDPPLPPSPRALDEIEQAYGHLFGLPPGLIDALDARGVVGLLRREDDARALADLLELDAAVCTRLGNADRAARRRVLARALREHHRPIAPPPG